MELVYNDSNPNPYPHMVYLDMSNMGSDILCPRGGVVRKPIGVQVSREVVLVFQSVVVERACS